MYCAIILGADKTIVLVATGNVEYHPLYLSIGNVHNTAWCAHRNAIVPIGFLAIPKNMSIHLLECITLHKLLGDRKYDIDALFCKFKHQLYHASLSTILKLLCPGMTEPMIRCCPDGHH